MIKIKDVDTIQIEITNICHNRCANCTRFVGLTGPFIMDFKTFKKAIDSLINFPNMVGIMGGEPLLHPEFDKFCQYALSKIPRMQLGLWTCLPEGYEKYRENIANTFGNIFINDHSQRNVYHHPFLVAIKDVIKDKNEMYYRIDNCFFQCAWSPSINPKGAYFCEMAASFAMLYKNMNKGWEVKKDWWKRTIKDYTRQIEEFCQYCGGALFLKRRLSVDDGFYDISPTNIDKLKDDEIYGDCFVLHNLEEIKFEEQEELAAYKDQNYRNSVAVRYGLFLSLNEKGFNEPYLIHDFKSHNSIIHKYQMRYQIGQQHL